MAKTKQGMPEAQFRAMQARYDKNRVPHVTVSGVESKSCATCARVKPLGEFRQNLDAWDGLQAECWKCRDEFWQVEQVKKFERRARLPPKIDPKVRRVEEDRVAIADGWRAINNRVRKRVASDSNQVSKAMRDSRLRAIRGPRAAGKEFLVCLGCQWNGYREFGAECPWCGGVTERPPREGNR